MCIVWVKGVVSVCIRLLGFIGVLLGYVVCVGIVVIVDVCGGGVYVVLWKML